jgi:sortase A
VGQVHETKQALEQQAAKERAEHTAVLSEEEAMYELRNDLIGKVRQRATKVRKSRHFWPLIAAMSVMLIFLFLQYNRLLFAEIAAYIRPGNVDQANIVVNPGDNSSITKDDRLIIPKINVDVPIIWTANAADQNSLNEAMNNGVAWFNIQQAHSRPGENGNFVLSGHSSNDWLDQGSYKFIFAPLEQMKVNDTFYVNYNQKRYMYKVTTTKVVAPSDVGSLATDNTKPMITLITCTPLGTALNRLLVFAEQVSPDPTLAAAPTATTESNASKMPTNSPTFWERIFGGGN